MEYQIRTTAPGTTIETIHHAPTGTEWTHATATHWAHTEGWRFPEGTRIAIDRRPTRHFGLYRAHRRYVVQDGITRRTDR